MPRLQLRPSRRLVLALALFHALALACVWLCGLPPAWGFGLTLPLLASVCGCVYRYGGYHGGFVVSLCPVPGSAVWRLTDRAGRVRELELSGYFLHPHLVILNFASGPGRPSVSLPLFPDMLAGPGALRRLRLHLAEKTGDGAVAV